MPGPWTDDLDPTPPLPAVDAGVRTMGSVLLAWGLHPRAGWHAGIAWAQPSAPIMGAYEANHLFTLWYPAAGVEAFPGEDYSKVPRVRLAGPPEKWPVLPAVDRHGQPWTRSHTHYFRPSPTGYWGTGPGAIHFRPGEEPYIDPG